MRFQDTRKHIAVTARAMRSEAAAAYILTLIRQELPQIHLLLLLLGRYFINVSRMSTLHRRRRAGPLHRTLRLRKGETYPCWAAGERTTPVLLRGPRVSRRPSASFGAV